MGACGSADEETKAAKAQQEMIEDKRSEDAGKVKLLLLGAGESGKSTIFKQMKILYGDPRMTADDMALLKSIIWNNLIVTMQTLCEASETFDLKVEDGAAEDAFALISDMDENDDMTDEIGEALRLLWADPAIQATWDRRSEFQIVDSVQYYFEHLGRIARPDYMKSPSDYDREGLLVLQQDALYARVRTSGIVVERYNIDGHAFEMYDVGGQRNERRKWINCFEEVTAVIFIVALSEYNQKLLEDSATNRMTEALELFDEICNNRCFREVPFILFLNKRDLFAKKIKEVPIASVPGFGDFDAFKSDQSGESEYEAGVHYFLEKFASRNPQKRDQIYHHVTCATDTTNISSVMDSCKEIILRNNMSDTGLI